ncbi:MAG: hypothetical protein COA58_15250 [Bacteroidetes bacterium]|nr:MAG: hypothetical protein COA58_15250 [Bacteroidota bacterium]
MKFRRGKDNFWSILIVCSCIVFSILFYKSVQSKDYEMAIISFLLVIVYVYSSYSFRFSKIEISSKGVTLISNFKTKIIPWENIKTYGIRSYLGRYKTEISLSKADKLTFGSKMIYVSTHNEFSYSFGQKLGLDYLTFSYRKEALKELDRYLKK